MQESFLEDVNCILNSGEVPDLFDNEETDGIAMELKTAASKEQIPDTRQSVFAFFIQVLQLYDTFFFLVSFRLISVFTQLI